MSQRRVDVQFPAAGADGAKIIALGLGGAEASAPDAYCSRCTYRWRPGLRWDWAKGRCPNCGSREVKALAQPQPPEAA